MTLQSRVFTNRWAGRSLPAFAFTASTLSKQPSKFVFLSSVFLRVSAMFLLKLGGPGIRPTLYQISLVGMDELSIVGTNMLYLVFLGGESDDEIRVILICGCQILNP